MVCWWPFDIADIPDGWVLCDGKNGTPDMRGYLAQGAPAGKDSGDCVGGDSHVHAFRQSLAFQNQDHQHDLFGDFGYPHTDSHDVADFLDSTRNYPLHTHGYSISTYNQSDSHRHRQVREVDSADSKQLSREQIFIMKT